MRGDSPVHVLAGRPQRGLGDRSGEAFAHEVVEIVEGGLVVRLDEVAEGDRTDLLGDALVDGDLAVGDRDVVLGLRPSVPQEDRSGQCQHQQGGGDERLAPPPLAFDLLGAHLLGDGVRLLGC